MGYFDAEEALFLLGVAVYFIPYAMAVSRNHPHKRAILLLNLCCGLTIWGWVLALAWANTKVEKGAPTG